MCKVLTGIHVFKTYFHHFLHIFHSKKFFEKFAIFFEKRKKPAKKVSLQV